MNNRIWVAALLLPLTAGCLASKPDTDPIVIDHTVSVEAPAETPTPVQTELDSLLEIAPSIQPYADAGTINEMVDTICSNVGDTGMLLAATAVADGTAGTAYPITDHDAGALVQYAVSMACPEYQEPI